MNLYFRLLLFFLKVRFLPKIDIIGKSILRFRVLPNDLDLNMHMNNGRYMTIMDIGRLDIMVRSGILKKATKKKYIPVLGGLQIRFRLPLNPFQAYTLESQIVAWDHEWAYILQEFVIRGGDKDGVVAATAIVKGRFFDAKNKKSVPIDDIVALSDSGAKTSPPIPEYCQEWIKSETHLKAATAR